MQTALIIVIVILLISAAVNIWLGLEWHKQKGQTKKCASRYGCPTVNNIPLTNPKPSPNVPRTITGKPAKTKTVTKPTFYKHIPPDLQYYNEKTHTLEPTVLDFGKLTSYNGAAHESEDGTYLIIEGPLLLADGLRVANDPAMQHVQKVYQKSHNEPNPLKVLWSHDYETLVGKILATTSASERKILSGEILHYLNYFKSYVNENKGVQAVLNRWKPVIDRLEKIYQWALNNKGTIDKITKEIEHPSWDDLWGWMKWIFVKHGGLFGLLKYFRHRIKWDIIHDVLHEKDYIKGGVGPVTGTGHCTACPASWWQNCPNDEVMIGSRGYKEGTACRHWYQHLSCEGLCQKATFNYTVPVGGFCEDIVKNLETFQKDAAIGVKIAHRLVKTLSTLGVLPKLVKFLIGAGEVISKALPLLGSDHWLFADIADVCSNFACPGNNYHTRQTCVGQPGGKFCVPYSKDFAALAKRDCPEEGPACLTKPIGRCVATYTT